MHPGRRLVVLAAALFASGVVASLFPLTLLTGTWSAAALTLALVAALDALAVWRRPDVLVERTLPDALALGAWTRVTLTLLLPGAGHSRRMQALEVFDHPPAEASFRHLPQSVVVPTQSRLELTYDVRMLSRGTHAFEPVALRLRSRLGLWHRSYRAGARQLVKVYPNFSAVSQMALLALDNRVSALGIHRKRRRGLGLDFHQLREYREGDLLRQIDWKASSRRREVISREYQDERDQQLVFLLDCGQRMRSSDGELTQFDHALNALLLVAYVALREGDAVGFSTFGGADRWFPPRKGAHVTTTLLGQLYDLQPTLEPSDYAEAVSRLLARQRRRALVVLLTNLREEDDDELPALLQTLRRRHLVVVASLREASIDANLDRPIEELDDALTHAASRTYLADRQRAVARLDGGGALALDVLPRNLPIALANKYLDIKRSGRL